jgi:hypothetical protein
MTQGSEGILKIERGNTTSYYVQNSLWKMLWTCRKTDCRMNEMVYLQITGNDSKTHLRIRIMNKSSQLRKSALHLYEARS